MMMMIDCTDDADNVISAQARERLCPVRVSMPISRRRTRIRGLRITWILGSGSRGVERIMICDGMWDGCCWAPIFCMNGTFMKTMFLTSYFCVWNYQVMV